MAGPLEGIRVIDCAHWIQGGTIGMMLGDLGAEVIKVEEPGAGDQVRGWLQTGYAVQTQRIERNYVLEFANRSKRSMTLDLRQEKGREILYRLVARSDVLVHNWRSDDVPQRLGADYETLAGINPRLVYVHASGWGNRGPLRGKPAFEPTAQARGGMLDIFTPRGGVPPIFPGGPVDVIGGMTAVVGTLAALQSRQSTGMGQKVEVSLLGSLLAIETGQLYSFLLNGVEYPKRSRATMGNPLWNHYCCADGKWITFAMTQPDRYWHNFCIAVGIEHLEHDPRFENMEVRAQNKVEFINLVDKVFATRTSKEWLSRFEEIGVDLIYSVAQSIPEVVADPQAIANEYIVDFDHPAFGHIKVTGIPYKFSRTPPLLTRAAPELGQHTAEVLQELGYTRDEIAQLKNEKVV